MIKNILATALVCASTVIAIPAFAISVTESTDFPGYPDFPNYSSFPGQPGYDLVTLDLGINTVNGSLASSCSSGSCNQGDGSDSQDSFVIHVSAGNQIDSLFVSTSNVFGPDGFTASFAMDESPDHTPVAWDYYLPLGSTSSNIVLTPIGAGEYSLSLYGQGAFDDGPYSLNYRIEMNVSAVPEPETYAMLLAGLGLVGFAVRRRKQTRI